MTERELVELSEPAKVIVAALMAESEGPPDCPYTGLPIKKVSEKTYVWMGYQYMLVYVSHLQRFRVDITRTADSQVIGCAYSSDGMYRVKEQNASELTG